MKDRIILHCDCNSFFASVELLSYPELANLPVVVSGQVDSRRGIILAKNEPAKKYGIKTAETVWQAKKKCPDLILLPPHHNKYKIYSKKINNIYQKFTDLVEPFGIDESWLDVTGSWKLFAKSPYEIAELIRKKVKAETGITISVGLSFNKIFAKLASDLKKPDITTEINKENYKNIIWPLPVSALLYVGKKACNDLENIQVRTIGQLAEADENLLFQVLGKQGPQLKKYALGEDNSKVNSAEYREPVKSVGNGTTFSRDLTDTNQVRSGVGALGDEVAARLRKAGLYTTCVQISIRDDKLKNISRQKMLPFATNLSKDIIKVSMELFEENWKPFKPIRKITITAQNLTDIPFTEQISLFEDNNKIDLKREKLETSIDKIREKYGKNSILEAGALHNKIGLDAKAELDKEDI